MKCRHCQKKVELEFVNLGLSPASNAYLRADELTKQESIYPLRVLCCQSCWLVQTEDFARADELFNKDYAYFSSFSSSWLDHCEHYTMKMTQRFNLNESSCVVEVAANDGYLLQYFKQQGVPNYGIEPTRSTAQAALTKGIDIIEEFFGEKTAIDLVDNDRQADLMIANNVLAHVPDINDFVKGFSRLLKPNGIATFEFPHLCELVKNNQFDTIYHEHFSYLSLSFVKRLFIFCGLEIFDVEKINTHGGSLRVYAQRIDFGSQTVEPSVDVLLKHEMKTGVESKAYYQGFQAKSDKVKQDLIAFVSQAKKEGKSISAYGAAAKGNTLINYSHLGIDDIDYVVDLNPQKQGKFLPGSHIPIVGEEVLKQNKPEYIIVFPWNIIDEIKQQLAYVNEWGGRLVIALPSLKIISP